FQDLAAGVHSDLLGEVAVGHGRGDLGDVADLGGEVGRHRVDVAGQVPPDPGHALDPGLAAELAFGCDASGDPVDLGGAAGQLVVPDVARCRSFQDLAAGVHSDLLGEVAVGHGRGDLGDVADLSGQVAGELVDALGQVPPGARHPGHPGLAAELAFGADLAGHAGDLVGEAGQLVDHGVDGVLQLQDLALGGNRDLLGEAALGDGGGDLRDVADRRGEVGRPRVRALGQAGPRARQPRPPGLGAAPPMRT